MHMILSCNKYQNLSPLFFPLSLNYLLKKENLEILYETEGKQETVHFTQSESKPYTSLV